MILQQDFLGNFSVQGWFAIAFPFYLLIFVRSLFLVFSSTSLHHLFLSFTISFNFSKPKPVFSFMQSIHLNCGLPCLLHPSTCSIIMSRSSVPFVLIKNYKDKKVSEMQLQIHHLSIDLLQVPTIIFKALPQLCFPFVSTGSHRINSTQTHILYK